jgi:carboxyl-terminal processing protease
VGYRTVIQSLVVLGTLASLASCGGGDGPPGSGLNGSGGGGGGGLAGGGGGGGSSSGYQKGIFPAASGFEAKCASPRTGANPATPGQNYPDVQGTTFDEKMWLRSWTNDLYLWYDEVADTNPGTFTVEAYFDLLKTTATTASGQDKDKFHFVFDSADWFELSQAGVSSGYGLTWSLISSRPPREVVVAYTEPGSTSPAAVNNLTRGAHVLSVDGVSINAPSSADADALNAGLFPESSGESHTFVIQEVSGTTRSVTMVSADIASTPVQNVSTLAAGSSKVGYLLFNDHIATAESGLIDAITSLSQQNINELVLDVRYNGGGFLDIASEIAYMIGGSGTAGKTFELLQFNSKHPTTDPVTGDPITPVPFHTTTQGFSETAGQPLPTLNLNRVFVITGPDTCSASESIINSLRGAGISVVQIGSTTCGKPYGFYPFDNCGTTYFSIQFRGVNNAGFGDYADGFSPQNTTGTKGVSLPGCSVADDFTHALGNPAEGRLSEALQYIANGSCASAPSGVSAKALINGRQPLSAVDGVTVKAPFLENRILRR